MKNQLSIIKYTIIIVLLIILAIPCHSQIQPTGCYSSSNALEACGATWIDYNNGVKNSCLCNCNVIPPAVCTPVSNGSGSNSSGSAIVLPFQLDPGGIDIDGDYHGKPFFNTDQSDALEEWGTEYKRFQDLYGNVNAMQIPLTGDFDFDKFYFGQSASFNPASAPVTPAPANTPDKETKTDDFSDKQGIVQLTHSEKDDAAEAKWMQENGLNTNPISANNGINADGSTGTNITQNAISFAEGQIPLSPLQGLIKDWETNLIGNIVPNLPNAVNGNASADDWDLSSLLWKTTKQTAVNAVTNEVAGAAMHGLNSAGQQTAIACLGAGAGKDYETGMKIGKYLMKGWGIFH